MSIQISKFFLALERFFTKNTELKLFFSFLIIFALFTHNYVASGNVGSRYATVQALVEYGTFSIDNSIFMGNAKWYNIDKNDQSYYLQRHYGQWFNGTNDKVLIEGHYYSDKPPVLSFLTAGLYWPLYKMNISFKTHPAVTSYLLSLLTVGIMSSLMLVYFYKSLGFAKLNFKTKIILTIILAFATLIFPYSITFNNHIIAASLLYICFYFRYVFSSKPSFIKKMDFFLKVLINNYYGI